jgi:hypothetical protein
MTYLPEGPPPLPKESGTSRHSRCARNDRNARTLGRGAQSITRPPLARKLLGPASPENRPDSRKSRAWRTPARWESESAYTKA